MGSSRGSSAVAVSIAAVAALALAACGGATPEPSAEASATHSDAPTASPSAPADHVIVSGDDVEILARLESPTTGEAWHEPTPIANLGLLAYPDYGIEDDYQYFEIGTHGDSTIVAAVPAYYDYLFGGYSVYAVFEVEGDVARLIDCPSARVSDICLDWGDDWEAPGRSIDADTHYDSLTYPVMVEPLPGWFLSTAHLHEADWADPRWTYGDANQFPGITLTADEQALLGRDDRTVLASLGDSTLVEFRAPGVVPGLTSSRLAIETPYGGFIPSESEFVEQWYGPGVVTWVDNRVTFSHTSPGADEAEDWGVSPARETCSTADETLAAEFDEADWVLGGTHALGQDVFLPVPGGNDIAEAVWQTMRDTSWGADIVPELEYPYPTYDEFLNERSVFAWQHPDGEWVIAIDSYAGQRVYECA